MNELPDIQQMEADLAEEMPKDLFLDQFQKEIAEKQLRGDV